MLPPRSPWQAGFPEVVLHTTLRIRDRHPDFPAAKAGDLDAALTLAAELLSADSVTGLQAIVGDGGAILLPVTAFEAEGHNAIPDAMAQLLSERLHWPVSLGDIVQSNRVGHTRAPAFNRLVTPASFEGPVVAGANYVLVDDHVGLGGTLANLKGHVEHSGGSVVAMTTLTESRDARRIALRADLLNVLRQQHGDGLEHLWQEQVGHGLDRLTNIEGEVLRRELSVDAIRDRLAQAAIEARERGLDAAL